MEHVDDGIIATFKNTLEEDIKEATKRRDDAINADIPSDNVNVSTIQAKQRNIRSREQELLALQELHEKCFPRREDVMWEAKRYLTKKGNLW